MMEESNLPIPTRGAGGNGTPRRHRDHLLPGHAEEDDQLLEPRRLARALWRRKWSMLAIFSAVVAIGVAVLLTRPDTYHSQTTFLIEEPSRAAGGATALSVLDRLGRANTIDTEIEILHSRRVLEPVVDALDLHVEVKDGKESRSSHDLFPAFRADRTAPEATYRLSARPAGGFAIQDKETGAIVAEGDWGETVAFGGLSFRVPEDVAGREVTLDVEPFASAVESLRKRIDTQSAGRDAAIIHLFCEARTAQKAEAVCSSIARNYMELRAELQRAEATAAEEFLREQVERIEKRLMAAEDSVSDYARRHQVVALETQANEEVRRFAELRARSEMLESELTALTGLLETIRSGPPDSRVYRNLASFPTFITGQNRLVTGLVEQLVDLENRRSELALRRTDSNPDVAALDERIRDVERQLMSTTEAYAGALEAQVESLNRTLASVGQELVHIPEQQVASARLQRQVLLLEELYTFLQTRLREAEVAQAVNLPSVRMIDHASLPPKPSSSGAALGFGFALLTGLAAAFMVGLVQEYRDTRVREPLDVERRTGVPVLSVIPRMRVRLGEHMLSREGNGKKLPRRAGANPERDAAIEAFRSLLTELTFAGEHLEVGGLRLVAVTSSARGEGKTFTACNLALTSALQGTRTLLIDADLRAMGATRLLGISGKEMGLADVLRGQVSASEAIVPFRVKEGVLHVMPAGYGRSLSSAALLQGDRLVETVMALRDDYDLLIVDTPPLNLISDAAAVAAQADGVLIVVRGGVTERPALELTLNRLDRARAHIAGIVVNDVDVPDYYYSPYGEIEEE